MLNLDPTRHSSEHGSETQVSCGATSTSVLWLGPSNIYVVSSQAPASSLVALYEKENRPSILWYAATRSVSHVLAAGPGVHMSPTY